MTTSCNLDIFINMHLKSFLSVWLIVCGCFGTSTGQVINDGAIDDFVQSFGLSSSDSADFQSLKGKDLSKVVTDLKKTIKKDKDHYSAYLLLAYIYYRQGDFDKAMGELNDLIARNSDYADAYFLKGNILLENENYQQALLNYKLTLKKDNAYTNALNNIAVIRIRNQGTGGIHQNDLKLAKSDILEIFTIDSTSNERILMNIGIIHIGLFEHQEAKDYFTKIIDRNATLLAEAYFNRALASYYLRQYDEAVADFTEAEMQGCDSDRVGEFIDHIKYIQSGGKRPEND